MKLGIISAAITAVCVSATAALALPVANVATGDGSFTATMLGAATGVQTLTGSQISPAWTAPANPVDASAAWIWTDPYVSPAAPTFEATFDLSGFDVASATLTGAWAVDNLGSVLLNGVEISTIPFGTDAFKTNTAFDANAGFVAGVNTVQFVLIDKGPSAAGLRAAFIVEADAFVPPAVPVPAALPLMLAGFAGLGFAARRRNKS